MRTLLREVATDRLTIALRGAPQSVVDAIFGGLSSRAADLIRDDLANMGHVRKADVEAARHEEAATVRQALEHLPAEQCQVIELAYFGGFTHTEIAEMLQTPVGTIKGRMRLGLEKLRHALGAGQVTLG